MKYLIVLFSIIISGCDQQFIKLSEQLMGINEDLVILSNHPQTLTSDGLVFSNQENKIKITGNSLSICLVLKTNSAITSFHQAKQYYNKIVGNKKLIGYLTLKSGRTIDFKNTSQEWNIHGIVTEKDELSFCLTTFYKEQNLSTDDEILRINISSNEPLPTLGVYWRSSNIDDLFNEKKN
ncbi:hypothetical protein [Acinetobacter venetianus]|uniref:hypothetical protein n=1 Tax=Acinetobacter venetianus TaxID=52133 RepID=UPI00214FB315|nr:hypothetical protein [Acinetobacter venetianus]MCR4529430.1 hypothetical protein [Acinetobacter venetianus]MDA0696790.1 hypothetical protein [Pseudomonadota bacterium]MDA1253537.1 hypothetical protein [Pseudomonadota bacterium]